MNRRGVLRMLGLGGAAAPIAAKQMADDMAGRLSGMAIDMPGYELAGGGAAPSASNEWATQSDFKSAFLNHVLRRQVEELLYEEEYRVGRIDPDIAVLRSFSLNAKITFQRQRNVALRKKILQEGESWKRLNKLALSGPVGRLLGLKR
jgi:hypothetical protein